MSPALTTTPRPTQAAILRQVLNSRYPKHDLGNIANNYGLAMVDLQAILRQHGYPDRSRMEAAAVTLGEPAAVAAAFEDLDQAASHPLEETPGPAEEVYQTVQVSKLLADPDNVRDELTGIEDLAASIIEVGLLQPIIVRREGRNLFVVAGHRRLAALRHLKHNETKVIIKAPMRPDDVLAAMLVENGQRRDLDPIEEARGLARLKAQLGCSDGELAKKVGRSQPTISGRLALLLLTPAEQAEVRNGTTNLSEAAYKGRLNAGTVGTTGVDRNWHLGPAHDLANQVKARCTRLGHLKGRKIGGQGCGECWETVIRADERSTLITASHNGPCPTCGTNA